MPVAVKTASPSGARAGFDPALPAENRRSQAGASHTGLGEVKRAGDARKQWRIGQLHVVIGKLQRARDFAVGRVS